jgi:hypothetical protein
LNIIGASPGGQSNKWRILYPSSWM